MQGLLLGKGCEHKGAGDRFLTGCKRAGGLWFMGGERIYDFSKMETWADTSRVVEFMIPIRSRCGHHETSHFPGLLILLRQTPVRSLSPKEEQADA